MGATPISWSMRVEESAGDRDPKRRAFEAERDTAEDAAGAVTAHPASRAGSRALQQCRQEAIESRQMSVAKCPWLFCAYRSKLEPKTF